MSESLFTAVSMMPAKSFLGAGWFLPALADKSNNMPIVKGNILFINVNLMNLKKSLSFRPSMGDQFRALTIYLKPAVKIPHRTGLP